MRMEPSPSLIRLSSAKIGVHTSGHGGDEKVTVLIRRTAWAPGTILGLAGSFGPYYDVWVNGSDDLFPSYTRLDDGLLRRVGWKLHRYGSGAVSEGGKEWDEVERSVRDAIGVGAEGRWIQLQDEVENSCEPGQDDMCIVDRTYLLHYERTTSACQWR